MTIQSETNTMKKIEVEVILWRTQAIPAWKAIRNISTLVIEQQKKDWEENHS